MKKFTQEEAEAMYRELKDAKRILVALQKAAHKVLKDSEKKRKELYEWAKKKGLIK